MKNNPSETNSIDSRIVEFIKGQTAFTLATCIGQLPYCCTCFYSFLEDTKALVFKSSKDTHHIQEGMQNKNVAGSLLPDKLQTGKVKGIQLNGILYEPEGDLLNAAKKSYYKKYPFAVAFEGDIWVVELSRLKFTDNTLGFGKKLIWEKA